MQEAPIEPDPTPPPMDAQTYANMKANFQHADVDGSNTLNVDELKRVMEACGMQPPADVHDLFSQYDQDANGKISFSEFMAAFHTQPEPEPPQINAAPSADGKFVDADFPPDNDSIFRSPNPAADHSHDVVAHALGGQYRHLADGPPKAMPPIQWKRLSELCDHGSLFHHVHPNDIAQGVLGDCWLLAGMAGMAEFEGAVFHLFQDKKVNDQGMYRINIFNPVAQKWESVVVDDFVPLGPDGLPLMAKPQGNEMWVLLLEKAFAKWFGSYVQIQGAYCLVGYMFMANVEGGCKCFSQNPQGREPFNTEVMHVVNASIGDAHNRNSVQLKPLGQMAQDTVWSELVKHDAANHVMCAWTSKDPPGGGAGRGASGELIANDGVVKGHAYSLISCREVEADGTVWRVMQLRNPWGANPAAEWKGPLSDNWADWGRFPELYEKLEMGQGTLDGMFWMAWDDFRARYSDLGVVPKQMEVPRMGVVEGAEKSGPAKHSKKFKKSDPAQAGPAPVPIQGTPQYVQPSRTIYASQPQVFAAAPTYAAAPSGSISIARPAATYAAAPTSVAFAPAASVSMGAPMTYAAAPMTYAAAPSYRVVR